MATLIQFAAFDNQTTANFKSTWQQMGNAFTAFGWASANALGSLNYTGNYGSATITNVAITSGVLTLTFSAPTNQFAYGQVIQLTGLTTNTDLNNLYLIVTSRTNTTLTANILHADVGSAPDTGTITALYNWNTVTAPVDDNTSNWPWNGTWRFRGAYVGVTPTFTNLQTTANQTTITFGSNGHGLDLTWTVGQGLNVSSVANASFTWLNSTPTGGWPILSLTSTTITINTVSSPRADIASTPVVAGTANPVYVGGQASSFVAADMVLYGGDMFVVSGSNSGTAFNNVTPGTDTTRWKRHAYEMWVSADALSSTHPLYIKFSYGYKFTASSNQNPWLFMYVGNGADGQGNITAGNMWPNGQTLELFMAATNVTRYGAPTNSTLFESDFSGASGRISAFLWRTFTTTGGNNGNNTPCAVFSVDRSKDNSGNDTDAYWTIVWCSGSGSYSGWSGWGSGQQFQAHVFKSGTGGSTYDDVIHVPNVHASPSSYNNGLCVLPVFPLVGYVGNPTLGCLGARYQDVGEGALVTVSLYGTTHTYLASRVGAGNGDYNTGGPINFGQPRFASAAALIRWE